VETECRAHRWRFAAGLLAFFLLALQPLAAQDPGTITGLVLSDAGTPLVGAQVRVETGQGTLTANNGRFMVRNVPAGTHEVSVTLIGYSTVTQTVTVPAGGVVTADFRLTMEALAMDELVVVGYAVQSERNISGAVTRIRAEDLQPVASTSVNQMLSGKVAGLNLTTRSAQPGGGVSVNVRGAISSGSNTPLYVIDGVPLNEFRQSMPGLETRDLGYFGGIDRDPLAYLNPSDIESITVLKDASAAAIYGSAAANGVVLITTKSAAAGTVQWRYSTNYSARRMHEYYPLLNAREFMEQNRRLSYDAWLWDNGLPPYGTKDPSQVTVPYIPLFSQADVQAAGPGTNWLDLVTRNGQILDHNLSVSGGSESTRAFASFNYRTEDGALRTSTFDKYSGRVNLDQVLGPRTRMGLRLAGTLMEGNNASTGTNSGGEEKYNMLQTAYKYAPTVAPRDENGDYTYSYYRVLMNPTAFLSIQDESRTTTLFGVTNLTQDLMQNLTLTVTGEYSQEGTDRGFYLPRGTNNQNLPEGAAQKATAYVFNYGSEGYLTYLGRVGPGDLQVVGGAGFYRAGQEGHSMQGVGFATDAFGYHNIGVALDNARNTIGSYKSRRTKLSQFARAQYNLRDRYIFSALARRDGSSIFAENKKYGLFPGASAAWIVSEESFFEGIPVINFMKIRAGYGEAGNESILAGNSLQLYNPGYPFLIGTTRYSGVAITQIANPNLTWETVKTSNLGIDFQLFENRIRGAFDVYSKTAVDRLAFNPLPTNNAVGRVADNVGSTRSTGFELTMGATALQRQQFRWDTNFNMSHSTGRWLERNPITVLRPWQSETDPLDVIFGWQTAGIIQTEADRPAHMPNANLGNIIFIDQNGDGVLNEEDVVPIGNSTPRWRFGLDNQVSYGGLSLSAFVYAHTAFKRGNTYAPSLYDIRQYTVPSNTTVFARDIWSHDHPAGKLPGVASNPYAQQAPSGNDFNLYDASFLRLRNVALSYQVPQSLLARMRGANNLRFVVDLQDLGVLTSYPGFDPEFTEANPYPKAYTLSFGAEVGF
jgi:TonB-dependent starch-binding outer membrane protein SusC